MPSTHETKHRVGAPVGQHIRKICTVLEQIGPSATRALCDRIEEIEQYNMGKYCSRAVGLGLMTVERGLRGRVPFTVFAVVPGWRKIVEAREPVNERQQLRSCNWGGVASIFQMDNAGCFFDQIGRRDALALQGRAAA